MAGLNDVDDVTGWNEMPTSTKRSTNSAKMASIVSLSEGQGRAVALLTRPLQDSNECACAVPTLDLSLVTTFGFDTDHLGTFTGEVERTLVSLEYARRKASAGWSFPASRMVFLWGQGVGL